MFVSYETTSVMKIFLQYDVDISKGHFNVRNNLAFYIISMPLMFVFAILGVRSLANASRARQFNPLNDQNPPGVG